MSILNKVVAGVVGGAAGLGAGVYTAKKTENIKVGVVVGVGTGAATGAITYAVANKVHPDPLPAVPQSPNETEDPMPPTENQLNAQIELVKKICGAAAEKASAGIDFALLGKLPASIEADCKRPGNLGTAAAKEQRDKMCTVYNLWAGQERVAKILTDFNNGNTDLSMMSADDAQSMVNLGYSVLHYSVRNAVTEKIYQEKFMKS